MEGWEPVVEGCSDISDTIVRTAFSASSLSAKPSFLNLGSKIVGAASSMFSSIFRNLLLFSDIRLWIRLLQVVLLFLIQIVP